jgi:hypothetical protein
LNIRRVTLEGVTACRQQVGKTVRLLDRIGVEDMLDGRVVEVSDGRRPVVATI